MLRDHFCHPVFPLVIFVNSEFQRLTRLSVNCLVTVQYCKKPQFIKFSCVQYGCIIISRFTYLYFHLLVLSHLYYFADNAFLTLQEAHSSHE